MINEQRFTMFSGDTKELTIAVTNTSGVPVDLTGATGVFTIAEVKNPTPEQIIAQKNANIEDAPGGIVTVKINPEDTAGKYGIYPFDFQVTLQNGDRLTAAFGYVTIEADVTNTETIKQPNGQLAATVDLTQFYTKEQVDTKIEQLTIGVAPNLNDGAEVGGDLIIKNGAAIYPAVPNTSTLGTINNPFADIYIGANSMYVDGQKIVSSVETTLDITTEVDNHISISTSGAGTTRLASAKEVILYSNQEVNIQSHGDVAALSDGNVSFQTSEIGGDITFQTLNVINDINFKGAGRIVMQSPDINFTTTPKVNGQAIPDKATADATYATKVHAHAIADVTNLQTTLDGKAPSNHTHAISGVTGLQTALDGKAAVTHTHQIADVSGLQTSLDGKASTTHNHDTVYSKLGHAHAISDVTNLQTTLDGKASTTHSHQISDVANLQTSLDGKANASTTYTKTEVDNKIAAVQTTGGVSINDTTASTTTTYSSTKIENALSNKSNVGHTHGISDVTGLQTALDGKQIAGDYATNTALTNGLAGKQAAGDYATNTALTNGLAAKANTTDVYTKTQSDANYATAGHTHAASVITFSNAQFTSTDVYHALDEVMTLINGANSSADTALTNSY